MTGIATSILSDQAIWRLVLDELTPYARSCVQALFSSEEFPPFFPFLIEAIEREAEDTRANRSPSPLMNVVVLSAISNPAFLDLTDALRLARAAMKLDDHLDNKLLSRLTAPPREWPHEVPEAETVRVLEVIDEISDCRRLVMPFMKFLKLPQQHLRSKVVKLLARASQNSRWAETVLSDPDPRVRSNLIDGLATHSGPQIEILLRKAAQDPHHRVATTALLELCRRGDEPSCDEIRRLSADGNDAHKLAANWALGKLEPKIAQEFAPEIAPEIALEIPVPGVGETTVGETT